MTADLDGPIRVAVAEDHRLVREGMCALLDAEPAVSVVGSAGTVAQAERVVTACRPDVLVLDAMLGGDDGIGAVPRIGRHHERLRILVLSAHEDAELARGALSAGAHGYLLKARGSGELVAAIRRVYAGERVVDEALLPALVEAMATKALAPVSVRELEVLRLVAEGTTTRAVGSQLGISERTVQKHLESLYRKLDVRSRTELVQQAFRTGLLR